MTAAKRPPIEDMSLHYGRGFGWSQGDCPSATLYKSGYEEFSLCQYALELEKELKEIKLLYMDAKIMLGLVPNVPELEAENKKLRDALEFYAGIRIDDVWEPDNGKRAREALGVVR